MGLSLLQFAHTHDLFLFWLLPFRIEQGDSGLGEFRLLDSCVGDGFYGELVFDLFVRFLGGFAFFDVLVG